MKKKFNLKPSTLIPLQVCGAQEAVGRPLGTVGQWAQAPACGPSRSPRGKKPNPEMLQMVNPAPL